MELRRFRYACFCLVVLVGTLPLWADVTGTISGSVRDKSGAVLTNATVTVVQVATGYTRTVRRDGAGQYSVLALPPGGYRLTASVAGFEKGVIENVNLNVNDALHFDFSLQVGSVNATVEVQADAQQIQTASTQLGTTIESNQLLPMPLNGRYYMHCRRMQEFAVSFSATSNFNNRAP